MNLSVRVQTREGLKSLATLAALIGRLTGVNAAMNVQGLRQTEAFPTFGATIAFFPGVHRGVQAQSLTADETFITIGTREWFLATMCALMFNELSLVSEHLFARTTGERFLGNQRICARLFGRGKLFTCQTHCH